MILVIATVRVHADKVGAYESAVAALMPKVRAANPGILFYHAGKARDEAHTFRVVEAYADQAAMDRHIGSALVRESLAGLQDCIAEIDIKLHDTVA